MRLSEKEKNIIVRAIKELDEKATIYLFGSRVQSDQKGGDIDLLVISETLGFTDKVSLLVKIKSALGEQKIDLMIKSARMASEDPFVKSILGLAKELTL